MSKFHKTLSVILIFILGFLIGNWQPLLAYKFSKNDHKEHNLETFWKVWDILDTQFVETKHKDKYGQVASTSSSTASTTDTMSKEEKRLLGAIKGLVDAEGDPYTTFFTPKETKEFESSIKGSFEGVGMELGLKDGVITVVAPIPESPSAKAGVKSGDKVIAIDGLITGDMSVEKAVSLIRGPKGTEVTLTLYRESVQNKFDLKIVRDTIELPTLTKNYDKTKGVYTIKIHSFSEKVTDLFVKAIDDMVATGSKKLVIDLRGNPGGYMEAAVYISSFFLKKGDVVVSQDYGVKKPTETSTSYGFTNIPYGIKVVVLVDGGSASASEIVAGALKDHGRATIVGTKTFGKGSVQEYIKVTPTSGLKVTIARWLTPSGHSISVEGLTPDVIVPITEDDVKKGLDSQYLKAVEILNK